MDTEAIRIRAIHLILQVAVVLPGTFLLSLSFIYLLGDSQFYNTFTGAAVILIAVFISHRVAQAFSGYDAVLSINNGCLLIESGGSVIANFYNSRKIDLVQIRAYEVHDNRMVQRLVLYRHDKNPVILILKRLSPPGLQEITSFLERNNIA